MLWGFLCPDTGLYIDLNALDRLDDTAFGHDYSDTVHSFDLVSTYTMEISTKTELLIDVKKVIGRLHPNKASQKNLRKEILNLRRQFTRCLLRQHHSKQNLYDLMMFFKLL